jgi:WD40 repeat protein
MKRQTWAMRVFMIILLSACSDMNAPVTPHWDAQPIFSVNENPEKDEPTSFTNIDWSMTNKITIRGLWLESYPVFIGEIEAGNVFPFYMDNSVVAGSVPVVSDDENYLAFQTRSKIYIALMSKVVSNKYSIVPESVVTVFDQHSRCSLAWSPNSLQLASVCLTLDGMKISLYNVGSDKPQDVFHYSEENIDDIERLSWSSDGATLAFSLRYRYDEEKNKTSQKDIFLYQLDTDELLRLTNSPDDEQYPDWYPGEDPILTFTFTAEGAAESLNSHLIFSTENGKCTKQVPNIKGIVSPSWSPDGSQLAYIADWMEIKILDTSQFVPSNFLSQEGLCGLQ